MPLAMLPRRARTKTHNRHPSWRLIFGAACLVILLSMAV